MAVLAGIFNRLFDRPALTPQQRQRLDSWRDLPRASLKSPLDGSRSVVVDVETSGLNLSKDRLISIGAVALVDGRIDLGDCFYVVLQQRIASDRQNILVHGIGGGAQAAGVPAADALLSFLEYLRRDPLIAFHVEFDRTMIRRAIAQHLGLSFDHPWLDLAYAMPALNPGSGCRSLDDWAARFGIPNASRHHALADAQVTAQLFQVAMAQAQKKRIADFAGLRDLEKAQRWVDSVG